MSVRSGAESANVQFVHIGDGLQEIESARSKSSMVPAASARSPALQSKMINVLRRIANSIKITQNLVYGINHLQVGGDVIVSGVN